MTVPEGREWGKVMTVEFAVTRKGQKRGKLVFGWLFDRRSREVKKMKSKGLVGGPGEVRTPDPMVANCNWWLYDGLLHTEID